MKNEINIVHLTQRRKHFVDLSHQMLSLCKFKNFDITICGCKNIDEKETYELYDRLSYLGLNTKVLIVATGAHNYSLKLQEISEYDYEYTIKMDEDIFLGPQAWDYFFNNINILNNDENILLTPALSTGIPTTDDFINYNFNDLEKEYVYNLFNKSNIPDLWGVNYKSIRDYLLKNKYDTNKYYNVVKDIQHHYKGIHPVRVNTDVVKYINNKILDKINMFFENREFFIKTLESPYLCNSFFGIKTKTYNKILNDKSLYPPGDGFDEVPINNYRNKTGNKFLTIPNTFGIHVLYNTLHCDMGLTLDEMNKMENDFYKSFSEKIVEYLK